MSLSGIHTDALGRIFNDRRVWFIAILSVIGGLIYHFKDTEAFPTAALDLNVSRQEIARKSAEWAHRLGYNKPKTIDSTTFDEDDGTKTFLEFELGTVRGGELMRTEVPVWLWSTRFCRERDPEECSVSLTPDGNFLAFRHTVANDLALPSISHDQAKRLAEEFSEKTAGKSLTGMKLVGDESKVQLKRKDFEFTWENRNLDYRGAHPRIKVTVQGDRVGAFSQPLNLPEEWIRRYAKIRSYNQQLYNVASIFWNILVAITIVTFFWGITTHQLRWKPAILLGLGFAVIQLLEGINAFPTIISQYKPLETSFNAYLTNQMIARLVLFTGSFAAGLVFAGSAEVIYRACFPKRIAIENIFPPQSWKLLEVSKGLLIGNISPMLYLGWIISYYLLGKHIGFYTPLSVENYRSLASSIVPAWSAVSVGVLAACHEEIIYRVVALNLTQKLIERIPKIPKNKTIIFWICNLLQATAWGFMHSTYPQQPCYARGLELTVSGLMFGWIFQSFGLLPCVVAHYLIDCFLCAKVLIDSAQPELSIPAIAAVSPFFLILLYSLYSRRRAASVIQVPVVSPDARTVSVPPEVTESIALKTSFDSFAMLERATSNEAVSKLIERKEVIAEEEVKHLDYRPLQSNLLKRVIIAALIFFILASLVSNPARVGRTSRITVGRAAAERIASQQLKNIGVDASQFSRVTWLTSDSNVPELQYFYEVVGRETAAKLANLENIGYYWVVRYFRPQEIREYYELIDGHGAELSTRVVEPEDAPGASLSQADAVKRASSFISKHHSEFLPLVEDSVVTTERDKRTDYEITFASPRLKIAESPAKVSVKVLGDKVTSYKQTWQVPDTWQIEHDRRRTFDSLKDGAGVIIKAALILVLCWWAIGIFRSGALRWRIALVCGAVQLVLGTLNEINNSQINLSTYTTSTTLDTFTTKLFVDSVQGILWGTLFMVVGAAVAFAVFRIVAPETSIYNLLRVGLRPANDTERLQQRQLWLDALICGYAFALVRWSFSNSVYALLVLASPQVQLGSTELLTHMSNVYSAQFDTVTEAILKGIKDPFGWAAMVGLYYKYAGSLRKAMFIMVILALQQNIADRYWQDYVIHILQSVVDLLLVYIFISKFARRNLFAYVLAGISGEMILRISVIVWHAPRVMFSDIISCVIVLLLPVAYVIWLYRNKITPEPGAESPAKKPSAAT